MNKTRIELPLKWIDLDKKKCSFCNKKGLFVVTENEPFSPMHIQCEHCDSTFMDIPLDE